MALLNLDVNATSRLGLEPLKDATGNYLFGGIVPAVILEVTVDEQEHTKGEFKDMKVPVLKVELENLKLNASEPDRYLTHTFKVVGSKQLVKGTTDQYENRAEVDILEDSTLLWKGLKHFLESLTGSPNYRNIINIPKADFNKYFDLPGVGDPKSRLDAYTAFFNYIALFVNGDGVNTKSQIVTAENKPLPIWVKVLPNYDKDPARNAKYYAISRYIGQGVFEPMKMDKGVPVSPKIIKIKANETLELSKNKGVPGGIPGGMPGTAMPSGAGTVDPAVAKLILGQQ